jgi:hypothetical protein
MIGLNPHSGKARRRPGTEGYTLFASRRPKHESKWSKKVPLRIVAMVLAGQILFAAGSPDVVAPGDPWAALEGRGGALLQFISTSDGNLLGKLQLDSVPVFDGMAAAYGRLYISM